MGKDEVNGLLSALTTHFQELSNLIDNACIYSPSLSHLQVHLQRFLTFLNDNSPTLEKNNCSNKLAQLTDLFVHFKTVLIHLSPEKWVQPALNWPPTYMHQYISGFITSVTSLAARMGIQTDILQYDQDLYKHADLSQLRDNLLDLKEDISGNAKAQTCLTNKIAEIEEILPKLTPLPKPAARIRNFQKKRAEEMLAQFKSIDIPVEDLRIGQKIGTGGFGTVYKATRLSTSEVVAIKELRKDRVFSSSSWALMYAEITTMASLKHPFILELVGAHITPPFRIITRYCPGKSLYHRLHKSQHKLSNAKLQKIAIQVASGMAYLHRMGIVHRDLKTLNILLDENDNCCVADFGLSEMYNEEMIGGVGTPQYTAPEVLMKSRYGHKIDTYSYGIVLWEMLTCKVPFQDMTPQMIVEHVVTRGWRLPIPNDHPQPLKKLISRCWSPNPSDRPEFEEIVTMFESNQVSFSHTPITCCGSYKEHIPIDISYVSTLIKTPSDPNFASVIYFLSDHFDDKLRGIIRSQMLKPNEYMKAQNDAVLILFSMVLTDKEYEGFFMSNGLEFFDLCLKSMDPLNVNAAVRFGCKVPREFLHRLQQHLDDLFMFVNEFPQLSGGFVLQFIDRFEFAVLRPFVGIIAKALLATTSKISSQQTFDAFVDLLWICIDKIEATDFLKFVPLLKLGFIVPPMFCGILIEKIPKKYHIKLPIDFLKAASKSDLTSCLTRFFIDLFDLVEDPFNELDTNELFESLNDLMNSDSYELALLVCFLLGRSKSAVLKVKNHTLIQSLLSKSQDNTKKLRILTSLTQCEEFCSSIYMPQVINFLFSSLSDRETVLDALRLVAAITSHETGCKIIGEHRITELLVQLFLSSSFGDSAIFLTIFRNLCKYHIKIPQISLVTSCLLQDILTSSLSKSDMLETLGDINDNAIDQDILRILQKSIEEKNPSFVYFTLRYLTKSKGIEDTRYNQELLLNSYNILSCQELQYPEIICEVLNLLEILPKRKDVVEFVKNTELKAYIDAVIKMVDADDPIIGVIMGKLEKIRNLVVSGNTD